MRLLVKQSLFAGMAARQISHVQDHGYLCSFGECMRTPDAAALNAKQGDGIANSLHIIKLALDLNIFHQDGTPLDEVEWLALGEFWEALGGAWGGRFGDRWHFSLEHEGVK